MGWLTQTFGMLQVWQWGLIGLVPPAIIALYFLKLKRRPLEVPSTYLWHKSIEESLVVVPEMLELCRQLEGKIPMAVLSNTIHDHAENLRSRGVYDLFNPCVLSCEVGMRKPESRIYHAVCELLNAPPERCLFIDDLQVNIKAARACRLQTHHFVGIESFRRKMVTLGLLETEEVG